jgi:hypothetical protein
VRLWQKSVILCIAVLALGAARIPYEAGLTRELRTARLLPSDLRIGTLEKIGQTSAAVAFGGLRTLVATFLNLRAFTYFTEKRWSDVADTYDTIVDLAPHTRYYWDAGYWHMAYNAASHYIYDTTLTPLRRKEAWRASIMKGRAFLERGIRNNPGDWVLHSDLGYLLSDPNKFPAFRNQDETFAAAADAYQKAADTGNALGYVRRFQLYALARVVGREAQALALARALYAEGPKNRTPTFLALLLVLEAHENPAMDPAARAIELFGTPQKAYESLSGHWQRTNERFPVYGVAAAMAALEIRLNIPEKDRILNQPLPPPRNPDKWFNE